MPHTDPFALRVMKALTEALEQVTPTNGYTNNLEGRVYRGRDLFGEDDEVPLVSILESMDELGQIPMPKFGTASAGDWELLVQGWAEDDKKNPSDPAYFLLADVRRRLAEVRADRRNILGMGGRVDDMTFGRGVVRPPDGISDKAYFWLRLTLKVVERVDKPFE